MPTKQEKIILVTLTSLMVVITAFAIYACMTMEPSISTEDKCESLGGLYLNSGLFSNDCVFPPNK